MPHTRALKSVSRPSSGNWYGLHSSSRHYGFM